jgi:type II secretory pathway pseudopilin PulG
MIELVFVIVILGIMAAVAVPRFASIQDDALISNEKTTIGVARQGVTTLYGKRQVRGGDFSITLSNKDGAEYTSAVYFSSSYFPYTLSVGATTGGGTTDNNVTSATTRGDYTALALVVEPEALADWNSSAHFDGSSELAIYTGPASNVVDDGNAEIHQGDWWEYNNTSGKIILQEN